MVDRVEEENTKKEIKDRIREERNKKCNILFITKKKMATRFLFLLIKTTLKQHLTKEWERKGKQYSRRNKRKSKEGNENEEKSVQAECRRDRKQQEKVGKEMENNEGEVKKETE